jgi:Domain of unknown function (DUF6457)
VTRDEWIAAFALQAGASRPSTEEVRELLELAGTAAHASERTAAPLACWIAGRSQLSLAELREIAGRLGAAPGDGDGDDSDGGSDGPTSGPTAQR